MAPYVGCKEAGMVNVRVGERVKYLGQWWFVHRILPVGFVVLLDGPTVAWTDLG